MNSAYTAVVAVRRRKTASEQTERFCICRVPDGKMVNNSDLVLFGPDNAPDFEKGICVSETIFVDPQTLEMLQTVTNSLEVLLEIKALIHIDWFNQQED